ncbi:MAG: hypothetical protein GX811_01625 [Lentisphaerae bacterium]|nr:hypothetical protein [Lentisphaerota bacterium]
MTKDLLKVLITLVAFCLFGGDVFSALKGSRWEDQPEELKKIYESWRETAGEKGIMRNHPASTPEEILKLKSAINEYSKSHYGTNLNWQYWGRSVESIYRLASTQIAKTCAESEAFVMEGVRLLQAAEIDDPDAALTPMVNLIAYHLHDWVESNPLECTKLWDNADRWFSLQDASSSKSYWNFHCATIQVRLLESISSKIQDPLMRSSRLQILGNYILNKSVNIRYRLIALRCLTNSLYKTGTIAELMHLVEALKDEEGLNADYYYARMAVNLFGDGNWEAATETLKTLCEYYAENQGASKGSGLKGYEQELLELALDLFYENALYPGIELKRRGKKIR